MRGGEILATDVGVRCTLDLSLTVFGTVLIATGRKMAEKETNTAHTGKHTDLIVVQIIR